MDIEKIFAPDLNTMRSVNPIGSLRDKNIKEQNKKDQKPIKQASIIQSLNEIRAATISNSNKQNTKQISEPDQVQFIKPFQQIFYNDLGGIDYLLETIKYKVENSLLTPEAFRQLGATPYVGVLIAGPTGTGKTALANAICNEINEKYKLQSNSNISFSTSNTQTQKSTCIQNNQNNICFQSIGATELISSKTGESENLIKQIFNTAIQNQPSIIYIDQLDIIAVKSENSTREFEKRLLSALISQLDQLQGQKVMVIGTTSKLESVDVQLRRNGRFDVEMQMLIPNRVQRQQILSKFLTMQLNQQEINEIAQLTPGYVPADIYQLLKESAIECMKQSQCQITLQNVKQALKLVQPMTKREGFASVPNCSIDLIGGLENIKELLQKYVLKPIQNPELYQKFNLQTSTGIVLYGAPGNGKSLLGRAIASMAEANFISVKGPELLNQYVGESERAVRVVFERARAARPVVLFLDECECLCRQRGSGSNSDVTDRIVNQFLTELDGVGSDRDGVFVIAATNRYDLLDKAIIRAGRLEKAIYVPFPNTQQKVDILQKLMQNVPFSENVNKAFFEEYCSKLEGYSGADLAAIVRETSLLCIQDKREAISREDFVQAAQTVKRSVSQKDMDYYQQFAIEQEKK